MKKLKFTVTHASIWIAVFAAILLALVLIIRKSFFGGEAYFLLRLAENFAIYDPLSFGGRYFSWGVGLPALLKVLPDFLLYALPALCGVLSLLIFGSLLRGFKLSLRQSLIAQIVLLLSPAFLSLFTTLNFYFLPVTLLLFSFWLAERKKPVLAGIVFLLLPLLSFSLALLGLLLLSLYFILWKKKDKSKFKFFAAVVFVISLVYYGAMIFLNGLSSLRVVGLSLGDITSNYISELGGMYGISVFLLIFAVVGVSFNFKLKLNKLLFFVSTFVLFVLSLFWEAALILFAFYVATFATLGIEMLFTKKYQKDVIKFLTILLIISGLLFATTSHMKSLVVSQPDDDMLSSMTFLENMPEGVVLSSIENGHFISYSGHQNYWDDQVYFAPNYPERIVDFDGILQVRNKEPVEEFLNKYDIDYILITEDMKQEYWEGREDGLYFVLKYSINFEKQYESSGVEIWSYTPTEDTDQS